MISSFIVYRKRQFFTSSLDTNRINNFVYSNIDSKNQLFITLFEKYIHQSHNSSLVQFIRNSIEQKDFVHSEKSTSWTSNIVDSFNSLIQQSFTVQSQSIKFIKMRKFQLNYFIENKSARRWFQKIKKTFDDNFESNEWIAKIESKLKNEIELWTKKSFTIQQMIKKNVEINIVDKNIFVTLLLKRFSKKKSNKKFEKIDLTNWKQFNNKKMKFWTIITNVWSIFFVQSKKSMIKMISS